MTCFAKIPAKEHYGLQLALRLAQTYYSKKPVSLNKISKIENISLKYLEQIVAEFKKANWVKSTRGRNGGYIMLRNPEEITLKDLVVLLDEETALVECLSEKMGTTCGIEKNCKSKKAWKKLQNTMDRTMQNIKFSELI